jgi:NDP-sugar pyrophosphorylase family protein
MQRQRLTITLKQEILKLLDNYVDGSKIRNRSHAIEFILGKHLLPETVKVLILTGGKGIKLRPITYEIPKVLIPIHGKPLLEYTLSMLSRQNFKEVILSIGYHGEKVKKSFENGSQFGIEIKYLKDRKKDSGTVRPLLAAQEYLKDNSFLVIHGDVLADIDYLDLLEFHKQHQGMATMALTTVRKPSKWGVVHMQGNRIVRFEEKPTHGVSSHVINAGIYVFNPEVFQYIDSSKKDLSREIFPVLAKKERLHGYLFKGKWHDVGTVGDYEKALKEWK